MSGGLKMGHVGDFKIKFRPTPTKMENTFIGLFCVLGNLENFMVFFQNKIIMQVIPICCHAGVYIRQFGAIFFPVVYF